MRFSSPMICRWGCHWEPCGAVCNGIPLLSKYASSLAVAGACVAARHDLPLLVMIRKRSMAWTTPTLVEICIGLEINGYLPAEF
jgi:coenzyme PQQ precursor peptide PqqA